MQIYGKTPDGGKRMIRCGCTEQFNPHDENIECFEGDSYLGRCEVCDKDYWYRIKPTVGGKRRPDDGR